MTKQIEKNDLQSLADQITKLAGKAERECADAVLEVVTGANATTIEKWREEAGMSKTLERIMEPEIKKWKEEAQRKGREEGLEAGREAGILLAKQVIRLDAQGVSTSEIARQTGVSEQDVLAILA